MVDRKPLVGDVVSHWLRLGRGRPTVLFGVNRIHAQHCAEQFEAAGVRVAYADANTSDAERDRLWGRLSAYEIEVACTVDIVSYGWDQPAVSCAIDARPTASLASYLQRVGRVVRSHPGKRDALVLDHAGNTARHGFAEDSREWSLDGVKRRPSNAQDTAMSVRTCLNCWLTFPSTKAVCPECGWRYESKTKQPEVIRGELQEITAEKRAAYIIRRLSDDPEIARLQKIAAEKGYKPGWVWMRIRELRKNGRPAPEAVAKWVFSEEKP